MIQQGIGYESCGRRTVEDRKATELHDIAEEVLQSMVYVFDDCEGISKRLIMLPVTLIDMLIWRLVVKLGKECKNEPGKKYLS